MYVCLSVQLCWPYRSVAQNIEHSLNTYYIARTVFDLNKRARNDLTLSIMNLAEQTTRYLESVLKANLTNIWCKLSIHNLTYDQFSHEC